MPAKTRIQAIDPTKAFETEGPARAEALRTQVLPRLSALLQILTSEAANTFGFDVLKYSDDITQATDEEAYAGLHPNDADYNALRGVRVPGFMLGVAANPEGIGIIFRVTGVQEWRLFIKALYQHREELGDYLAEFEELFLLNSDGEEEAIEELDQFFAIDVEGPVFKQQGCTVYFPGLEYPLETEEDLETLGGDFAALFPLYWTLLKSVRGEPVDMDKLLNG
jgi:hypothetical protein